MRYVSWRLRLAPLALVCVAAGSAAQDTTPLSADDLVQIRQLMDSYAQILDHCVDSGEDYAALFAEDGTFGVSSEWGGGAKIWFRGHEELARVGSAGCGPQRVQGRSFHLNINPLIRATPQGAWARSTLLTITNDTDDRGDIVHYEGGYEDTFVRTKDGWRFNSRVHVWEEVDWTDRPEDMPPRNLADE